MIKEIKLTNFKCYQKPTRFELGKINLLTGINGKGKSTLLQSLLLFRQSVEHNERTNTLLLNGNCVRLGTFSDVKNAYTSSKDPIKIHFKVANEANPIILNCYYEFVAPHKDERSLQLEVFGAYATEKLDDYESSTYKKIFIYHPRNKKTANWIGLYLDKDTHRHRYRQGQQEFFNSLLPEQTKIGHLESDQSWHFQDFLSYKNIHYICADRLGPQEFYPKNNISDFVHVGKQGELVADVLSHAKKEQLITDSSLARSEDRLILSQVSEWLGYILDQPIFSIVLDDADKYRSSILFKMGDKTYAAPNVGFGYAYMLPIVVSGLIAKKGEIWIIENPEAHLHPKAQSRLTEFLVQVAQTGVQVFVESHSDHIVNALRVGVKNKAMDKSDVKVFFFTNDPNESSPQIYKPTIDEDGRIDEWPEGFFDEWNNNLIELL